MDSSDGLGGRYFFGGWLADRKRQPIQRLVLACAALSLPFAMIPGLHKRRSGAPSYVDCDVCRIRLRCAFGDLCERGLLREPRGFIHRRRGRGIVERTARDHNAVLRKDVRLATLRRCFLGRCQLSASGICGLGALLARIRTKKGKVLFELIPQACATGVFPRDLEAYLGYSRLYTADTRRKTATVTGVHKMSRANQWS